LDEQRKTYARVELFRFGPKADIGEAANRGIIWGNLTQS
jgi:hypothetical protein